jgi:hypothetical protein
MSDAQKPHAWAVKACSRMWMGEFAEVDAKAEAARVGCMGHAYPLFTKPTPPDGWEEAVAGARRSYLYKDGLKQSEETSICKAILDMDTKLKELK